MLDTFGLQSSFLEEGAAALDLGGGQEMLVVEGFAAPVDFFDGFARGVGAEAFGQVGEFAVQFEALVLARPEGDEPGVVLGVEDVALEADVEGNIVGGHVGVENGDDGVELLSVDCEGEAVAGESDAHWQYWGHSEVLFESRKLKQAETNAAGWFGAEPASHPAGADTARIRLGACWP